MKAKAYKAAVTIKNLDAQGGKLINAKSIMSILAASIRAGTNIEIMAEGEEEKTAVNELVILVESGFSEKQEVG